MADGLRARVSAGGCTLVPAQTGVLGAFGSLLAAVADLASRGAWLRPCGTQMSQRAYRSRLRNG